MLSDTPNTVSKNIGHSPLDIDADVRGGQTREDSPANHRPPNTKMNAYIPKIETSGNKTQVSKSLNNINFTQPAKY